MPGFDGTGPAGQGPFTGKGRGFCVIPLDHNSRSSLSVTGSQNNPVSICYTDQKVNSGFYDPFYLDRQTVYIRRRGRRTSSLRGMGMRGRWRKC